MTNDGGKNLNISAKPDVEEEKLGASNLYFICNAINKFHDLPHIPEINNIRKMDLVIL